MSEDVLIEILCPACKAPLSAGAASCAACGAAIESADEPLRNQYDEPRWMVISLMLFAALFLGFPYLWKNPRFSRLEKIVWTVIVLAESVVVFWLFFWAMSWCIGRIRETL